MYGICRCPYFLVSTLTGSLDLRIYRKQQVEKALTRFALSVLIKESHLLTTNFYRKDLLFYGSDH